MPSSLPWLCLVTYVFFLCLCEELPILRVYDTPIGRATLFSCLLDYALHSVSILLSIASSATLLSRDYPLFSRNNDNNELARYVLIMTQLQRSDSHAIRSQDGRSPDPTITDGFNIQDLGATDEAPPAYGDSLDHLQLSQGGFEAGAAVTGESPFRDHRLYERRIADAEIVRGKTMAASTSTSMSATASSLPFWARRFAAR